MLILSILKNYYYFSLAFALFVGLPSGVLSNVLFYWNIKNYNQAKASEK